MTINLESFSQSPSQGERYWVLGDLYTFKASGEKTGQAYALIEIEMQPNSSVPPHVHRHEDEAFYVLAGRFEFHLENQVLSCDAGTFLHSPRGQRHHFSNVSSTPSKMLCWITPSGLENFFREIGTSAAEITASPAVSPADIEKVMATAPRYGLEIIPPPS